jgi:hypothetical protein
MTSEYIFSGLSSFSPEPEDKPVAGIPPITNWFPAVNRELYQAQMKLRRAAFDLSQSRKTLKRKADELAEKTKEQASFEASNKRRVGSHPVVDLTGAQSDVQYVRTVIDLTTSASNNIICYRFSF